VVSSALIINMHSNNVPTQKQYPIVLSSPVRSLTPSKHYSTPLANDHDYGSDSAMQFENQIGYFDLVGHSQRIVGKRTTRK
jgi:hypothetical protein